MSISPVVPLARSMLPVRLVLSALPVLLVPARLVEPPGHPAIGKLPITDSATPPATRALSTVPLPTNEATKGVAGWASTWSGAPPWTTLPCDLTPTERQSLGQGKSGAVRVEPG